MGMNSWRGRGGYAETLKNDYQVILFDARGHGQSDKPHEISDYGPKMAGDVIAILDSLGISKSHYFGYSTGALTGFLLATGHAQRFSSFIFLEMGAYGLPEDMVKATKEGEAGFKLPAEDPEASIAAWERSFKRSMTPEQRKEFLARDGAALSAMFGAQLAIPPLTDQDLAGITVPCLLLCGELDSLHPGAKESANHIPQAKFVTLPGLNHVAAFTHSDLVLPHIKEFLATVSKT
jgi:pimeloyl-ACP methyl ester carboxylesterase